MLARVDYLKEQFLLDPDFDNGEAAHILEMIASFLNPQRDYSPQTRRMDHTLRMRSAVECWRRFNGCMQTPPQRINAGLYRVSRSLEECFRNIVELRLSFTKRKKLSDYLGMLFPMNVPHELRETLYWVVAVRLAGDRRDFHPLLRLWLDDEHRTPPAGFDEGGRLHYEAA